MAGTGFTLLFSVIKNNDDEMISNPKNDRIDNQTIFSMFIDYLYVSLNPILKFQVCFILICLHVKTMVEKIYCTGKVSQMRI
jgi:hypothetical protein